MKQSLLSDCQVLRHSFSFVLTALLLTSAACNTKQAENGNTHADSAAAAGALGSSSTDPAKPIQGIDWAFLQIDGVTQSTGMAGSRAFINFGLDGRLHGHSGCNNMSGSYTFVGSNLEIGPVAMTRMFCDGFMDLEAKVSDVVTKVKSYGFAGDTLLLKEGDKTLAKLLPIDG